MNGRKPRGRRLAPQRKTWAKKACGCPVVIDAEQRQHLIECCAFFHAARFRDVRWGQYRRQDLQQAARDVDAVLQAHATTGSSRDDRPRSRASGKAGTKPG
jgi:hypothetical protein